MLAFRKKTSPSRSLFYTDKKHFPADSETYPLDREPGEVQCVLAISYADSSLTQLSAELTDQLLARSPGPLVSHIALPTIRSVGIVPAFSLGAPTGIGRCPESVK